MFDTEKSKIQHELMMAYYKKNQNQYAYENTYSELEKEIRKYSEQLRTLPNESSYNEFNAGSKIESASLSKSMEAQNMKPINDNYITHSFLDLVKKELKSEITTVRVEMKQQNEGLKTEIANLRLEIKTLSNKLTNAMELLAQKMDENTAKMRVDIEEQRRHWSIAVDHYGPLYSRQNNHEERILKLETRK